MEYKRILLKLSGEALKSNENIFDLKIIQGIAEQIINLNNEKYEIAIVIGGGNIWRGSRSQGLEIDQSNSDYIGMVATLMNSLVLLNILNNLKNNIGIIFSKLVIRDLIEPFNHEKVIEKLKQKKITILAGGTGSPFFTTDTTAALRALEIKADIILMAKNNIDGIYDSDPNINKDAKFFSTIKYKDIIEKQLSAIDFTAATLLQNKKIKTLVFNINQKNSIYNILINNNVKHTIIS